MTAAASAFLVLHVDEHGEQREEIRAYVASDGGLALERWHREAVDEAMRPWQDDGIALPPAALPRLYELLGVQLARLAESARGANQLTLDLMTGGAP